MNSQGMCEVLWYRCAGEGIRIHYAELGGKELACRGRLQTFHKNK